MTAKKRKIIGLIALLCVIALLVVFFVGAVSMPAKSETPPKRLQFLTDAETGENWLNVDDAVASWKPDKPVLVKADQKAIIPVTVPAAGKYRLALKFRMPTDAMQDQNILVNVGKQSFTSNLHFLWKDATLTYSSDRYNNQLVPDQKLLQTATTDVLKDKASLTGTGAVVELPQGETKVEITPQTLDLNVYALYVLPETSFGTASASGNAGKPSLVTVQGEYYRAKSDSYIRSGNQKDPSITPYDMDKSYMNILLGDSFNTVGQKVLWEFQVEEAGWYSVNFRYYQNDNANLPVFRCGEIDGKCPSEAWENIRFPYCKSSQYQMMTVKNSDKSDAKIWLEPGTHTLSLCVNSELLSKPYQQVLTTLKKINDIGTAVRVMTGGRTDENRTWDVEDYIPNIKTDLADIQNQLGQIYDEMETICGAKPTFADTLNSAVGTMKTLRKDLRKFPNKMNLFSEGSGSIAQTLGNLVANFQDSALSLDCFYLSSGEKVPSSNSNFVVKAADGCRSFAQTFSNKSSSSYAVSGKRDEKAINVWVNRPVQYLQVMQFMADSQFTKKTGIKVDLAIMPNEQRLILASSSGACPDAATGVAFYIPYDFAIRGGTKNLLEYKDFLPWVNSEYNLDSLLPMCFDNKVYGATETQDFYIQMYRKDILDQLGLKVPQTWDDVKSMMPILRRYGMSYNTVIANQIGTRNLIATSPFIYQNGADFYTKNGAQSTFTQDKVAGGFQNMTDMFRIYSLPTYVSSFFNGLRYGTVPIGIGNFSTYLQMEYAAPELASQWDISLAPGTMMGGENVRYQNADATACMVFKGDKNKEDGAYQFIKWWLSADTQTQFSYTLRNRFGPYFQWNTANIKAFNNQSYSPEHKKVILEQWKWQRENLRHPATYMVERESSNVFTSTIVDHENLRYALDRAKMNSDLEIQRKLQEFGYVDKNGKIIKEYKTDTIAYLRQLLKE